MTTPLKIKILKKWKKHPQGFTQGTSVQNFSQIGPFLKSPACPKVLRKTYKQIHRYIRIHRHTRIHRHSQILAQLKLRIVKSLNFISEPFWGIGKVQKCTTSLQHCTISLGPYQLGWTAMEPLKIFQFQSPQFHFWNFLMELGEPKSTL